MKIIEVEADPVRDAMLQVNECGHRIATVLTEQLTLAVRAVMPLNATFWSDERVGNKGTGLLQKLGAHIQLLSTFYPEHLNEILKGAAVNLKPQQDGTVVYTPPPPPPPPPPSPPEYQFEDKIVYLVTWADDGQRVLTPVVPSDDGLVRIKNADGIVFAVDPKTGDATQEGT